MLKIVICTFVILKLIVEPNPLECIAELNQKYNKTISIPHFKTTFQRALRFYNHSLPKVSLNTVIVNNSVRVVWRDLGL